MANSEAWVTLATNDSYCLGALVLGTSLRRVGTTRDLVVLVTASVTPSMRTALESVFTLVQEVSVLDSGDEANLALLTRPELGITFTKLHCWKLTQYAKCVFLDADALVIQGCDELFEREEFSAAPDSGWPDCFNSGVFVYKPSLETYERLLAFALEQGSFDGGDQGLLNSFFSDWATADIKKHLPFIYNMVASAIYSYLPAYKVFGANVKIAHFIGPNKPWLQFMDTATGTVHPSPGQENVRDLLQAWWDIFKAEVHQKLVPEMGEDPNATVLEQVQNLSFQSMETTPSSSVAPPLFEHEEPIDLDNLNVAIRRHTPEYLCRPPHFQAPPPHYEPPQTAPPAHVHQPHYDHHEHHQHHVYAQPHQEHHQHQVPHQEPPPPHHHESHHQHHFHSETHHQPHFSSETHHHQPHFETPHQGSPASHEHHHPQHMSHHPIESHQTRSTHAQNDPPYAPPPTAPPQNSELTRNPPTSQSHPPPGTFSVQIAAPEAILPVSADGSSVPIVAESPRKAGTKGLAGVFAQMSLEGSKTAEQLEQESIMRKHAWEQGHIDFLGKDSFDNIFKKIQESMAQASSERAKKEKTPEKVVKERSPPKAIPEPAPAPVETIQAPVTAPTTEAAVPPAQAEVPLEPATQSVPAEAIAPSSALPSVPPAPSVQAEVPPAAGVEPPTPVVPAAAVAPSSALPSVPAADTPPAQAAACKRITVTEEILPPIEAIRLDERVPVDEPLVTQSHCAEPCVCHPHPTQAAEAPPRELSLDELEDEILAVERAALEKKLAEQKRVAEQKLISEKAAAAEAEAAALKQIEAIAAEAAKSAPAPEAAQQVPASPTAATAPPPAAVDSKPVVTAAPTEPIVPIPAPSEAPVAAAPAKSSPAEVSGPPKPEPPIAAAPAKSEAPVKPEPPAAVAAPKSEPPVASAPAPVAAPPPQAAAAPPKSEPPAAAPAKPEAQAAAPAKKEGAGGSAGGKEPKAPPRKQAAKAWSLSSLATTGMAIAGVSLGAILFLRR